MLSWYTKREIPIIIFTVGFIISLFGGFVTIPIISGPSTFLVKNVAYIALFPVYFGVILTTRYHFNKIIRPKKKEDYVSILTIIFMIAMIFASWSMGSFYEFLFYRLMQPISIAIVSYVGFYIMSAMYRGFKARNLYAIVFLISAVIVMITNAPLLLQVFPGAIVLRDWFNDVPQTSAMRTVLIVTLLGMIALAGRAVLGYERSAIGGGTE